ncbi:hypothetical protein HY623_03285 [Candidatus Uhrbacteria bacterium]|nr:hypothetical protein [Candidatus Uhrbacteria bacterium]
MANLKQEINAKLQNAGEANAGYASTDIAAVIGNVVLTLLTILGVVFIVLIVFAGFRWMLAQGEEQKITEARNLIIHSIIGLLVVLAAYAISYFVISALQKAV